MIPTHSTAWQVLIDRLSFGYLVVFDIIQSDSSDKRCSDGSVHSSSRVESTSKGGGDNKVGTSGSR